MAMYQRDARELRPEIAKEFSETLTVRQLWLLVRLMKTARRSCRSNSALYSFLQELFPYASFRDVPKNNKWGKGLEITVDTEHYKDSYSGTVGEAEEE